MTCWSCKAAVPEGQNPWVSRWRFAAYIEPVLPVSYEARNIAWLIEQVSHSSNSIWTEYHISYFSNHASLLCAITNFKAFLACT